MQTLHSSTQRGEKRGAVRPVMSKQSAFELCILNFELLSGFLRQCVCTSPRMFEHPQPPDSSPRREGVPDVIDAPPPDIPVVPPPDIPPADLPDVPTPQRDFPGPR
jgi:hypothetical protein